MTKHFASASSFALGLVMILSTGCESGGFKGGTKTTEKAPQEQPREESQDQQVEPTGEQQTGPQTTYQPPAQEEESSQETQVTPTTPQTTPQPSTTPATVPQVAAQSIPTPVQPQQVSAGAIHLKVIGIINMDSKYQLTNEGTRLVLSDATRGVIASGKVNLTSIMDGQPVDQQGSAYGRPFALRITPEFMHDDVKSGALAGDSSVQLSVCQPENLATEFNQSVQCKNLNQYLGHSNGINTMVDLTAQVSISRDAINIKSISGAQDHGGCGTSEIPCVALTHPINNFAAKSGENANDNASPLVLDLNKNGKLDLETVWTKKPVKFDLNGAGKLVRTGWVSKQDGLLALDHNRDGLINSGKELFGEYSQCVKKKCAASFGEGFSALEQYDSNNDYRIDAKDAVFAKLKVWRDLNQDGVSQKKELFSLKSLKIQSISLNYKALQKGDAGYKVADNTVKYQGSYTSTSGKSYQVGDVWFEIRQHRSMEEIVLAGKKL